MRVSQDAYPRLPRNLAAIFSCRSITAAAAFAAVLSAEKAFSLPSAAAFLEASASLAAAESPSPLSFLPPCGVFDAPNAFRKSKRVKLSVLFVLLLSNFH
ncbi:MAG TPA: hypothetical protein IAB90_00850 [Candidatus Coproplasma stercoripullorum]|uniref:Uncharacterized protein n=1 Tax=Candidatus Coproplasma stercoripullorum TaxID=2840751 RepID=A0A9D1DBV3_9FIRM|nr:hypothetical protein [Candidatus Coproplasma stercoripullorum]